jgi:hypothetical protein
MCCICVTQRNNHTYQEKIVIPQAQAAEQTSGIAGSSRSATGAEIL